MRWIPADVFGDLLLPRRRRRLGRVSPAGRAFLVPSRGDRKHRGERLDPIPLPAIVEESDVRHPIDEPVERWGRINLRPGWIDGLPVTGERRQRVPIGHHGLATELAAAVGFLASDGSGYIIGRRIRVDGRVARFV